MSTIALADSDVSIAPRRGRPQLEHSACLGRLAREARRASARPRQGSRMKTARVGRDTVHAIRRRGGAPARDGARRVHGDHLRRSSPRVAELESRIAWTSVALPAPLFPFSPIRLAARRACRARDRSAAPVVVVLSDRDRARLPPGGRRCGARDQVGDVPWGRRRRARHLQTETSTSRARRAFGFGNQATMSCPRLASPEEDEIVGTWRTPVGHRDSSASSLSTLTNFAFPANSPATSPRSGSFLQGGHSLP